MTILLKRIRRDQAKKNSRGINCALHANKLWVIGHMCAKGKAHYIEVFPEDDEDDLED